MEKLSKHGWNWIFFLTMRSGHQKISDLCMKTSAMLGDTKFTISSCAELMLNLNLSQTMLNVNVCVLAFLWCLLH